MTISFVMRDYFPCVTWLIHMCDATLFVSLCDEKQRESRHMWREAKEMYVTYLVILVTSHMGSSPLSRMKWSRHTWEVVPYHEWNGHLTHYTFVCHEVCDELRNTHTLRNTHICVTRLSLLLVTYPCTWHLFQSNEPCTWRLFLNNEPYMFRLMSPICHGEWAQWAKALPIKRPLYLSAVLKWDETNNTLVPLNNKTRPLLISLDLWSVLFPFIACFIPFIECFIPS